MYDRLVRHYSLPDYFKLVTYVDLGWPDQSPCTIWRCGVDEAVIHRSQDMSKDL